MMKAMSDEVKKDEKGAGRDWRKIGRRLLWTVVVLLTLVVLFYQVERWRGARAWEAAKKDYLAAGGSLDLATYLPSPVPDAQNFGALPILEEVWLSGSEVGEKNRKRLSDWRVGLRSGRASFPPSLGSDPRRRESFLQRWAEYLGVEGGFKLPREEAGEKVLEAMEPRIGDIFAELAVGVDRPESQLPPEFYAQLNDRTLYELGLPHMSALMHLARALHARGIAAVETGEPGVARESIAMSMQLGRLGPTKGVIGVLISDGAERRASHIAEQGIHAGIWTNEDLDWILHRFDKPGARRELQEALEAEAIAMMQRIELAMGHGGGFDMKVVGEKYAGLKSFLRRIAPDGWYDLNRALVLRLGQPTLELAGGNEQYREMWRRSEDVEELVGRDSETFSPSRYQVAMLYPRVSRYVRRSMELEMRHRLLRTACAIELHRREHGAVPHELQDLVPEYLAEVPTDLVDGNPVRYRDELEGAFVLYMIGLDGVDNGGLRPGPNSYETDGTDIVWGKD